MLRDAETFLQGGERAHGRRVGICVTAKACSYERTCFWRRRPVSRFGRRRTPRVQEAMVRRNLVLSEPTLDGGESPHRLP